MSGDIKIVQILDEDAIYFLREMVFSLSLQTIKPTKVEFYVSQSLYDKNHKVIEREITANSLLCPFSIKKIGPEYTEKVFLTKLFFDLLNNEDSQGFIFSNQAVKYTEDALDRLTRRSNGRMISVGGYREALYCFDKSTGIHCAQKYPSATLGAGRGAVFLNGVDVTGFVFIPRGFGKNIIAKIPSLDWPDCFQAVLAYSTANDLIEPSNLGSILGDSLNLQFSSRFRAKEEFHKWYGPTRLGWHDFRDTLSVRVDAKELIAISKNQFGQRGYVENEFKRIFEAVFRRYPNYVERFFFFSIRAIRFLKRPYRLASSIYEKCVYLKRRLKLVLSYFKLVFRGGIESTPIYINNFNRFTTLKLQIDWFRAQGFNNITVIDNNSTYQPLLSYYEQLGVGVKLIKLGENVGPLSLWQKRIDGEIRNRLPYIYTDSDVVPVDFDLKTFIKKSLGYFFRLPGFQKIGLSLKIDDLPDWYEFKKDVIRHESHFWDKEYGSEHYLARVDTTFAIYQPGAEGGHWLSALRTKAPFLARHWPWYENSKNPSEEEKYYYESSSAFSSWSGRKKIK